MRHGKPAGQGLLVVHIQQRATVYALRAPAVLDIAQTRQGHITGSPIAQSQSIQMAAILGHPIADARRSPHRPQIVAWAGGSDSVQRRGDKPRRALRIDHQIMDIQLPQHPALARHIQAVRAIAGLLALVQHIGQAP
jgi:hypothetical protein